MKRRHAIPNQTNDQALRAAYIEVLGRLAIVGLGFLIFDWILRVPA